MVIRRETERRDVHDGFDRLCRLYFPVTTLGANTANTGGVAEGALTCASGGTAPGNALVQVGPGSAAAAAVFQNKINANVRQGIYNAVRNGRW